MKQLKILMLVMLLAGCELSTTQSISPKDRTPTGFATWTDQVAPYELLPGDRIRVQFLLTPEFNEEALVAPDGLISIRAANAITAMGRTLVQLQSDIETASSLLLNGPKVTVSLAEPPHTPVFVGGSVGRPGAYEIHGRHGPLEAVQIAGGFTPEARVNKVVLIRRDRSDHPMLRVVDLKGFVEGSDDRPDVPLVAGDIVFVPRNEISEVDMWIDQFITRFLPFNRSFSYAFNKTGAGI